MLSSTFGLAVLLGTRGRLDRTREAFRAADLAMADADAELPAAYAAKIRLLHEAPDKVAQFLDDATVRAALQQVRERADSDEKTSGSALAARLRILPAILRDFPHAAGLAGLHPRRQRGMQRANAADDFHQLHSRHRIKEMDPDEARWVG